MSPSLGPQTYEGEEVAVTFDAGLCIHSEERVAAVAAAAPEEAVLTVSRNGPLLLRGRLRIENAAGETIATATRLGFVKP